MRALLVAMSAVAMLVGTALRADATVVNGTSSPSVASVGFGTAATPFLNTGTLCSPSAASLDNEPDRGLPMNEGHPQAPTNPVPVLTPEAGARYLQYAGDNLKGHGLLEQFGIGDIPTAVSVRAAAPSGTAWAVPVVIAVTADANQSDGAHGGSGPGTGVMGYVGIANQRHWTQLGPSWTTVNLDLSDTGVFTWFTWDSTNHFVAAPTAPWSAGPNVMYFRPTWFYRVGFMFGCGDTGGPIDVDQLAATSAHKAASGWGTFDPPTQNITTRTWDFEGVASAVSASASPSAVTYGQPVTISATARQGSTPAAVPLRLVRCQGATCQFLGDPVTSSPSTPVSFTVHPQPGWTYGVRYDGDGTFDPAQSDVAIAVRSKLVVGLSQQRAHVGDTITVGGLVGPCAGAPRRLVIQRLVRGTWRAVGRAQAAGCAVVGRGQFKPLHGAVRLRTTGTWRLRVVAPAAGGSVTTVSRTFRVAVTRAPVRHVATVHYAPAPAANTDHTTTTAAPPPPPT